MTPKAGLQSVERKQSSFPSYRPPHTAFTRSAAAASAAVSVRLAAITSWSCVRREPLPRRPTARSKRAATSGPPVAQTALNASTKPGSRARDRRSSRISAEMRENGVSSTRHMCMKPAADSERRAAGRKPVHVNTPGPCELCAAAGVSPCAEDAAPCCAMNVQHKSQLLSRSATYCLSR